MLILYSTVGLVILLLLLGSIKQFYRLKEINFFLACSILMLVSGLRYLPGGDYLVYANNYENYKLAGLFDGYPIANVLIAHISTFLYDDYTTLIFIYAFISIYLITYTLRKKSVNFKYSLLLFIFMGMWHGTFNIMKQYAAISILFAAQQFIAKRNFKYWLGACMIAELFHPTAIFMLPVYFFVTTPISKKKIILSIVVIIGLAVSYQYLFNMVSFFKPEGTGVTIDSDIGSRSVNILRVAVNCAPAIFYFFVKSIIRFKDTDDSKIYGNFAVLNAIIYVACSNSVYLTRFGAYTDIFGTLLYPYLLSKIRSRNMRFLIGAIILLLYFIFWNIDITKGQYKDSFSLIIF